MSDGPGDQAFDFNALAAKDAEANDAPFDFNGLAAKDPLPDLSATQSFGVSAARSAIPAAAGLVTGGAGAEIGAAIGAVGGPIGMVAGGIVGGLIGGIGGGIAASKAQDYALEKLAPTWKDPIDKYTLAAQDQHPTASFLGGLAPFALTMSPRTLTSALPENATAIERIMSNPLTGRMFSGALQGGMEIGQEAYDGHGINWSHGAMAFGFGMVFYRPNALGEKLTHAGARPVQTGLDAIRGPKAEKPEPTIAEAGDVNVMGPGVTEEVFHGGHAASPEAEASLRDTARAEMEATGGREPTGPDPHVVVRRAEPELFDRYDELARQRDEFRQAITEHHNPPAETLAAAEAHAQEIQDRLTAHIEAANGYTGGKEARSLRAELRSRQAVVDELNARSKRFAAGEAADTPELATLREKLLSVDNEMRDLAPQVSAAYRRAADTHNAETVGATPLNDLRDQMAFEHMNHEGGKDFYTKSGPRNEYAEQMASVPRETLDGYVAHGISATRDGMSREDALASILRERGELTQAAHPLPTAEERATGVGATRTDAPYILLYRGDRATGKPDFVIVNTRRAEALDAARRAFPGENIVSPSEAAAQLKAAKPISQPVSHEAQQSYVGKEVAKPVEEQKAIIAADVERQLIAAGRPRDEASSAGQLVAARYVTRARLFDGKLGTAEELYAREGPRIVGQGGTARVAAAPGPVRPQPPAPAAPAAEPMSIGGQKLDEALAARLRARMAPQPIAETVAAAPVQAAYEAHERIADLTLTQQRKELPTYSPEADASLAPKGKDQPVGVFMFDPTALNVDANRFQFKSDGDQSGVNTALKGVTKWDASKAQAIIVWEQMDGRLFVADGHQRTGLARRLVERGAEKELHLPGLLYREKDGISAADVRAIAAVANIANGSGSAIDGAKVLRARPDLIDGSIPLSAGKGQQAAALARLGDEPFRMVINDVVPENFGAIVGDTLPNDHDRQLAAMKAIARFEPRNVDEASALVRRIATAELARVEDGRQVSMFGDLEAPESTAGEEMKIVGRALGDLKKDKGLFARIVANAERIEESGSHIEREAAGRIKTEADVFAKVLTSEAYAAGPVRDALVAAAKELKDGRVQIGDASSRIVAAIRRQIEENGLDRVGHSGRAVEPAPQEGRQIELAQEGGEGVGAVGRELFQRDQKNADQNGLEFEAGAENKPQSLVPGVKPVTDRERIESAAAKPLRGGNAPMQEGGLFGEGKNQGELFQQAKGKIHLVEGRRPIITLMKDADASTFIHETGHDFLEQMMRDSMHPDAPGGLRDDMDATLRWLGARSVDDIKTKHHEKFARGFEQYMREGVAPSRGLAHVFAQFKSWLTQIYQSIKGLGAPISDDVRRVFDRMLEVDPQHTVIAPERASGPTIHDIHAEEARYTEPHEAAPAAERVDYERARAEEELKPEVRDELAQVVARQEAEREVKAAGAAARTEPGSEARAGEGGSGEVEPGGGRPEPVPGGGAGSEGSGKVGGGFRAPMGESSGVSERPRPGSDSNPLAPRPTDLIERPDSGLTDKAGNIRLENLTSVEDVRQAMREAADAHGGFMKERRGVITDGEIQDAAYDLGMVGAERIARDRILGQAFSAEEILALRLAVRTAAGEVGRLAKIANPSDEQVMQFVAARERQVVLQAAVSQATAEWGRAGRALRNITHLPEGMGGDLGQVAQQVTGKTLFQIKEEMKVIAAMDTPQQVAKWMVDSQKRSIGRGLLEYFVNNLISGVATHVTYVAGNAALLTEKLGVITPVAAVIAKMRGREGEYVRMGEVQAGWKAMLDAMPAAIKGTVDAARSSTNIKMPGEEHGPMNPFDMYGDAFPQAVADFGTKWRDVAPDVSGMFRGMRDGLMSIGSLSKAGLFDKDAPWFNAKYSHLGVIPDIQIKGANLLPVGSVVRAPSRMVAAIHATFRVLNYSIDLAQQSYRMAAAEGLTGDALARRVGELRNAPTEDMMQAARTTASDLTVIGQSGEFMRRVSALTGWETELPVLGSIQPLKFIDPFVHIAGQIVKKSVGEQSPLALLSSSVRADLAGHNGPVAQDMTAAKIMVGTALGVTVMGLAAQGLVSGSGPHDKNEKAMWLLAGNQAHSVRIGNTWYDVHRLGPLGVLVSVAADMYEVAHLASKDEMQKAGAAFLNAVVHTFMDEGFLRGPADLLKAIEDPARYGDAYIRNFATSFVPFATLSNQTARAMDPHMRQVRTMMDAIKNRIPGLSETLLPKRDIWGEPMANSSALGGRAVTAIYEKKMSTDPVNIAMIQHGVSFGPVPRKIRNVELDDQQYDDFARIAGRTAKMQLDKIVRAPAFQQLPAHLRRDLLNETVKQAREAGRNMIMMKYPQIVRQATQDRLDTLREAPTPIE